MDANSRPAVFQYGLSPQLFNYKGLFFFCFALFCFLSHRTILGGCSWKVGRRTVVPLTYSMDGFKRETIQ